MTLKEIRTILNMTQEDIAKELEVNVKNIQRWENNKHKPLKIFQAKIDGLKEKALSIKLFS